MKRSILFAMVLVLGQLLICVILFLYLLALLNNKSI